MSSWLCSHFHRSTVPSQLSCLLGTYAGGKEDGSWKKPKSPVPSPGWAGGHAYSRDGLNWSSWTRCYNTSVALADGTTINFPRRERPKLLFDKEGNPTHLYNGQFASNARLATHNSSFHFWLMRAFAGWLGAIPERGMTYTIVSPLNVPANQER